MKKLVGLLLLVGICLTGCSRGDVVDIAGYSWRMTSVQGGEDGAVVACPADRAGSYEKAAVLELRCEAENGVLTLTDSTNAKTYTGKYQVTKTSPEATIYEVTIGDTEGYAVTGMTTYLDGSQDPTFILSIDGYSINFRADTGAERTPG